MRNYKKKIAALVIAAISPLSSFAENELQSEQAPSPDTNVAGNSASTKSNDSSVTAPVTEMINTKAVNNGDAPITVAGPLKVAERPFYHGSGLFALGGAIGGLIASQVYKDEPERIAAYVSQEKIDIAAIIKAEFEQQINAKPEFMATFKAKAPANFEMFILYGITSVPFKAYRPYLSVHVKLVDPTGAIKWKNRDYVGGHGDAPSIPYEDFYKSPEVFLSEFSVAAHEVVALLLKDFHL
jgi:hypothetical protein